MKVRELMNVLARAKPEAEVVAQLWLDDDEPFNWDGRFDGCHLTDKGDVMLVVDEGHANDSGDVVDAEVSS